MQLGRHIHRTMNLSRQISSRPYKYVYNDRGIVFHEKNWTANILCFFYKLMARGPEHVEIKESLYSDEV